MPTGYTADVITGKVTEFKDFALQCARGMGALIMMRDDAFNAPIPVFEPSDFYQKRIVESEAELAEWNAASRQTRLEMYAKAVKERMEKNARWAAERKAARERYEAMLAKVEAWTPPTEDHEGMKKFMLEQLTESIKFDCSEIALDDLPDFAEWQVRHGEELAKSVMWDKKHWQEEIDRTRGRNEWVAALKESIQ